MFSLEFVPPRGGWVGYLWFQIPSTSLVPCPFREGRVYGGRVYISTLGIETTADVGTHPTGMLSCTEHLVTLKYMNQKDIFLEN